jgi:hypothetical protein
VRHFTHRDDEGEVVPVEPSARPKRRRGALAGMAARFMRSGARPQPAND